MMVFRISNLQFTRLWPLLPKTMHSAVDFEGWKLADEEDKEDDDDLNNNNAEPKGKRRVQYFAASELHRGEIFHLGQQY